jgi:beta-N-acetylhexosaminidase
MAAAAPLATLRADTPAGAALSNSQLAAQVIMAGIDSCGAVSGAEKRRLTAIPVGAIMLFKKNLTAAIPDIKRMNGELCAVIEEACGIKPFIALDHEGGIIYRFENEVARLPAPFSYSRLAVQEGTGAALARIRLDAALAAGELNRLGITMNLAPVVEPLTAENRAFLDTRSYGEDPVWAGAAALSFVQGMAQGGVFCVLKHFPGNSAADPHMARPVWNAGTGELKRLVAPFQSVITAHPRCAVMLSHAVVPAWDEKNNASLSPDIIARLRNEYRFDGIVIADDFSMGAVKGIAPPEELAVRAVLAGADMVMAWPNNLGAVHGALLRALETGRLPRSRMAGAVARIVRAKQAYNPAFSSASAENPSERRAARLTGFPFLRAVCR